MNHNADKSKQPTMVSCLDVLYIKTAAINDIFLVVHLMGRMGAEVKGKKEWHSGE